MADLNCLKINNLILIFAKESFFGIFEIKSLKIRKMAKTPTPEWVKEKFLNNTEIIALLYPEKELTSAVRGRFSQKKTGKRPWTAEELSRLEEIRQEFLKRLEKS